MKAARSVCVLLSMALLAATGCGARLSDDQRAAVAAGGAQGAGAPVAASLGATLPFVGESTATSAPGSGAGSPEPTASSGVDGGAAPIADDGSAACSPQPTDEVGVSDTEIHLGNVSTISGPIPGLGRTSVNATRAYLEYMNSQGGVCGRRLVLDTADDRLDTGQNRAEAQRLSSSVLGFVGGFSVVDGGLANVVADTNIVSTGQVVSDVAIASPNMFSPLPIDPSGTTQGTRGMWEYFTRTRGITKVAIVYIAQSDARARALAYRPDIEGAGLSVDGPYEVALTETNYVNVAQQMENNGADGVITALDVTGMARLAQAFDQIDYHPAVRFYGAQAYGRQFLELAGDAGEGTTIGLAMAPFEDAPANPTVATMLEWYQRVAPDSEPDFFAILSWCATDMMVQALQAAGPAPTRDAVLAHLAGLHQFDAHGFLAPNDPAGKHASPLFMIVTVQNGQWVREYPASGFGDGT